MGRHPNGYDAAVSATNETRLPRRTVVAIGGAGLALLATGCRAGEGPSAGKSRATRPSADLVTVGTAVSLLEESIARLQAISAAPAPVTASLQLHRVHLSRLQGVTRTSSSPSASATPTTTSYPRRLGTAARVSEGKLVHQLTGFAQGADSGDLARLFAAMAAATSQRLAAWPAAKGAR